MQFLRVGKIGLVLFLLLPFLLMFFLARKIGCVCNISCDENVPFYLKSITLFIIVQILKHSLINCDLVMIDLKKNKSSV